MRKNLSTIILILIFLVGLSVMLYPSVSDAVNRKHQSRAVAGYAEEVEQLSDADYQTYFDAADAYNRQLNTTPNAFYKPDLVSGYAQTLDISGTGIMGYITIPKISVELPIYHGTDEGVLQVAAGHLEGSSLPVGGAGTHAVISAHRGLPSAKLFTNLDELEVGDRFTITVLNRVLTYEVDQISIVLPTEIDQLLPTEGMDYVTLMTCTPYGINTHRLLVRGKRVETTESQSISVWRQMHSALNPSSWPRFWPSRCYLRHWSVCWLPHICASAAREGGNNIMKSIRDRLAVLLMLCLLVWGAVPALAAETVDETRIGSIKVLLCDTETAAPLQGGELTLYRVASVSKNGADMSFTYANGFENCGIALDNVSESALASRLAEKVTQNAQAVTKTINDSGIAVFGDLKAGLYLIVQKQAAEGYDAIQPFLVTVPIMENGQYVYDVDAHPKAGTSSRKTTQTPPTQEVLSALPQTGQLNWPVPVLAVTGAVLVAAGVVLKKRSGQNEK